MRHAKWKFQFASLFDCLDALIFPISVLLTALYNWIDVIVSYWRKSETECKQTATFEFFCFLWTSFEDSVVLKKTCTKIFQLGLINVTCGICLHEFFSFFFVFLHFVSPCSFFVEYYVNRLPACWCVPTPF